MVAQIKLLQSYLRDHKLSNLRYINDNIDRSPLGYVSQVLSELRVVAEKQNEPMLCYLIELALAEAQERSKSVGKDKP